MGKINKIPPKRRRVGLFYDERMCGHKNPGKSEHVENPDRIRAVWDKLNKSGVAKRCVVLAAKEAEDDNLALVHTKEHIDLIKTISSRNSKTMRKSAKEFDSIFFNKGSSKAAYLAAGSVIEAAEKVANGELDSAFAIVRPPGHHAEEDEPMGFCLYNNVAIAASFLLNERPELGMKKILIVDWDVHHGNSTQKMFYQDPQVLFFSVHRHDSGSFFPFGDDGSYDMIGEGPGAGYNINVPWENDMCGDADYLAVWDHILIPVAKEFDPDMIIISAGFDAVIDDPIGGCCVSPNGFSVMLHKLMGFAKGKIVMALEGGYNHSQLANSVQACIEVLLQKKPISRSLEDRPLETTWHVIQAVGQALSVHWPVLAAKLPDVIKSTPSQIGIDIGGGHVSEEEASRHTTSSLQTEFLDNSFDFDSNIEIDEETVSNLELITEAMENGNCKASNASEVSENDQSTAADGAWEVDKADPKRKQDLSGEENDDEQFNKLQIRYDNWHRRRSSRSRELATWVAWHEEEDWVFEFTGATSLVEAMDANKFLDILRRKRPELIRYKEKLRSKGKKAVIDNDVLFLGRRDDLKSAQAREYANEEQQHGQEQIDVSPTGSRDEVWPSFTHRKRGRAGPHDTSPCCKLGKGLFSYGQDSSKYVGTVNEGDKMSEDDIRLSIMRSANEFESQLDQSLTKMDLLFSIVSVNGAQHKVHATHSDTTEKISRDEVAYLRKKNKQFKAAKDRAEKALDHEITTGEKFLDSEFGNEWLKKAGNDAVGEFKKSKAFYKEISDAVSHIHDEAMKNFLQRFRDRTLPG